MARGVLEPDWVFEAKSATCFWLDCSATPSNGAPPVPTVDATAAHGGAEAPITDAAALVKPATHAADADVALDVALSTVDADTGVEGWVALAAVRADATSGTAGGHAAMDLNMMSPAFLSTAGTTDLAEEIAGTWAHSLSAPAPVPILEAGDVQLAPPQLELWLRPCEPSAWQRFHPFHYKTAQLSTAAATFLLEATIHLPRLPRLPHLSPYDVPEPTARVQHVSLALTEPSATAPTPPVTVVVPAGFVATTPHSGKCTAEATAPPQRAHRTVVLPEFQGFGIGSRLSDAAGEWHRRRGSDFYGQTAHPRFGAYRDASRLWEPTAANHTMPELRWLPRRLTGAQQQQAIAVRRQHPRMVFAHRYVGVRPGDAVAAGYLHSRVRFV